jgi:hypothetical protein
MIYQNFFVRLNSFLAQIGHFLNKPWLPTTRYHCYKTIFSLSLMMQKISLSVCPQQ